MIDDGPPDISAISQEQAGQLLDRMVAAHRNANPEPFKLTTAEADDKLTEITKAALTPSDGRLSPYKTLAFAAALDEAGIPAAGIKTILEDNKFTAADVEWARGVKTRMISDSEFTKALVGGNAKARHEFTAVMAILCSQAGRQAP
jgi:hypothetical protein